MKLSPKEETVLRLYLKVGALRPVAEALQVSLNTVKSQRASVMRKLGAKNLVQLTLSAIRKGFIEP